MTTHHSPEVSAPGPGLSLVLARQRVIRAVLDIQITSVTESHAGSAGASAQYRELTEAARVLVTAEDVWGQALRERAARHVMPSAQPSASPETTTPDYQEWKP